MTLGNFNMDEWDPNAVYELECTWSEWMKISRGRRKLFKQMKERGELKIRIKRDRPILCI